MLRASVSILALVACGSLAVAADLEGPSYVGSLKDGFVAPAYNWTGLYVGGHVGYGWGNSGVDLSHTSGAIHWNDRFDPDHGSLNVSDGWLGGFQAGYNHQLNGIVVGIEADVSWTGMDAHGQFTTLPPNWATWDIDTSLDIFGTVRGRLGYVVSPNLLVYATGGFAWGRVEAKQATNYYPPAPPDVGGRTSGDVNHFGYAIGGGAEWAITPRLSLQAQYLYADLGKENYMLNGMNKPEGGVPYTETFAADLDFHTARVGVNYKFGN